MARGQLTLNASDAEHENEQYDEALAAFGLQQDPDQEPQEHDVCYLWPVNVEVFVLWRELQTQWRAGAAGVTGLDYTSVLAYLRGIAGFKPSQIKETFPLIQAMERATLIAFDEMRRENSDK